MTTAMAMYKAVKIVEKEYPDGCTKAEAIKLAWKYFLLPGGVTLATMASILSGALISNKRQASILAAYAVLKKSYDEYRAYAKRLVGDNMDENIAKAVEYSSAEHATDPDDDTLLFYDAFSERYFNAKMVEVIDAMYHFNRNFQLRGYASLNECYEFLDLPTMADGEKFGWSIAAGFERYGYQWVDFDLELTTMDDGLECYILTFPFGPSMDYLDID